MKKYFFLVMFILFLSPICCAQELQLAKSNVNINDVASIKRGAKFFSTICMACHTMIYLRFDKLAQEQGVTYEKMPINVTKWPTAVKPPDLSLEASVRGADWIYTYLHSFYMDKSRPTGFNNLLVPNSSMPDILAGFQGQQVLASDVKDMQKIYDHQYQWYDLLEESTKGSMTPEQYDALITDVVNFLQYAAEPYKAEQNRLGYWVIGFLLIFLVLIYLLKRAYWKDLHE